VVLVLSLPVVGCGRPASVEMPVATQIEGYEEAARTISADPVAFLRECLVRTNSLPAFTATFQRQERLGLLRQLRPEERMTAEFRQEPFSVRFTWLNPDSEFRQCVYVSGRNDNQVQLVRRKAAGHPPPVESYPASFAVLFQQARNPITDFGPRRMMERILDRIEKAGRKGGVKFRLREPTLIGVEKDPCIHLELRYPPGDPYACKLQDLYIHARTHLPVGTYLWLPGRKERCEDTLDALYIYGGLKPVDRLGDEHFVLDTLPRLRVGTDVRTAGQSGAE
jgi:hypothetical protein